MRWEETAREKLKTPEPIVTDSPMLIDLANAFLDFVKERRSRKTYVDKQAVMKRMLKRFGRDTEGADIQVAAEAQG